MRRVAAGRHLRGTQKNNGSRPRAWSSLVGAPFTPACRVVAVPTTRVREVARPPRGVARSVAFAQRQLRSLATARGQPRARVQSSGNSAATHADQESGMAVRRV